MSDQNIVAFNTCLDVHNHRYILDFLNQISVENSMAFLPVTIHDPNFTQEEYIEYLFNYVDGELNYLIQTVAESDPKLWKYAAESLKEQIKNSSNLIRFVITLTSVDEHGLPLQELHELVCMWDTESDSYVLINYAFNHDSLVSLATNEFLYPEIDGMLIEPQPVNIMLKS